MSLRPEEIDRIKWELGVSMTRLGAEPYITYVAIFDRVIQPYLFDNSTTSATSVATAGTQAITLAANPTPPNNVGLTFNVGTTIVVDVGPQQETAVIQVLSGLSATITFANTHTSTPYVVSPYGSEQIVRDIFARLDVIKSELLNVAPRTAGMQQVDEVKVYPSSPIGGRSSSKDKFDSLVAQREQARNDLAEAVGFENLRNLRRSAVASVAPY